MKELSISYNGLRLIHSQIMFSKQRQLTPDAVIQLCRGQVDEEGKLMQIYNIQQKLNKHQSITNFILSDGVHCIQVYHLFNPNIHPRSHQFALVRVVEVFLPKKGDVIGIINFRIQETYGHLIGNPQLYHRHIQSSGAVQQKNNEPMIQEEKHERPVNIKQQANSSIKIENERINSQVFGEMVGATKIKDLSLDMINCNLVCKVVEWSCTFQNTTMKIQTFKILLKDSSQMLIYAICVGQVAQQIKKMIVTNSVYKFTNLKIQQKKYFNSNKYKLSPFVVFINSDSTIERVRGDYFHNAISIHQLLGKSSLEKYDVVAVLVDIQKQKIVFKEGRKLYLTILIIADPVSKKTINVAIWNHLPKPESSLIGKTVLLNQIQLKTYTQGPYLNYKAASNIQALPQHYYSNFEEKALKQYKHYNNISKNNQIRVKMESESAGSRVS